MTNFEPKTPFEGWIFSELKNIKKGFENHLKHHWAIELILVSAVVGLITKIFLSQ